jgi:hypothetical protein
MVQAAKQPDGVKRLAATIGLLAFLGGIVLAIVGGIGYQGYGSITLALVIMGILVGLLNITGKEVLPLLIAAIALIVVGTGGIEIGNSKGVFGALNDLGGGAGDKLNAIVAYLAAFMAPAAVISAFRAIWAVARPG